VIFQPAEEGRGGARAMVEERLFERFPCGAVYALHNLEALRAVDGVARVRVAGLRPVARALAAPGDEPQC
jgi:metal-dependent amidase/aminoacylase/carboxypeptidase family protein